jgi:hypothetical protein
MSSKEKWQVEEASRAERSIVWGPGVPEIA